MSVCGYVCKIVLFIVANDAILHGERGGGRRFGIFVIIEVHSGKDHVFFCL